MAVPARVAIIGGSVMGFSTAYHLAVQRGSGRGITVFEADAAYRRSVCPE